LADDGYRSDESFSEEFYMTIHEDLLDKLKASNVKDPSTDEDLLR
jgi:hypothetical protein